MRQHSHNISLPSTLRDAAANGEERVVESEPQPGGFFRGAISTFVGILDRFASPLIRILVKVVRILDPNQDAGETRPSLDRRMITGNSTILPTFSSTSAEAARNLDLVGT